MARGQRRTSAGAALLVTAAILATTIVATRWWNPQFCWGSHALAVGQGVFVLGLQSPNGFGQSGLTLERITVPAPGMDWWFLFRPSDGSYGLVYLLNTAATGAPNSCRVLYVQLWPAAILASLSGLLFLRSGAAIRRRLANPAACPRCGYLVSSLPPGSPCPECGPTPAPDTRPGLTDQPGKAGP